MLRVVVAIGAISCLAACSGGGGGAVQPKAQSAAVQGVLCSSSMGPLPEGVDAGDAGDVEGCQPGGQCLLVGGSPGSGSCGYRDGGFVCPSSSSPSWSCVYSGGMGGPGGDGG